MRAVFRYFNENNGDHFYTTDYNELGAGDSTWRLEASPAFYIESDKGRLKNPLPLSRWFYDADGGYHFYSVDVANEELEGWRLEDPEMGYCSSTDEAGMVKLYRYRNENNHGHFYTTNYDELGAGNRDWFLEASPMCYVYGTSDLNAGSSLGTPTPVLDP